MIDDLITANENIATSNFLIDNKNILAEDNVFSVSGLLENIAQTAAAQVGYLSVQNNVPVPIGFIGAISKVLVQKLPQVNSKIETIIEVKQEVFNITLIAGEVKQDGELLISCQMKIMIDKKTIE